MTFYVENETDADFGFDHEKQFQIVAEAVLDYEKCPYEAEISLTVTTAERIREINREHREIDRVTDVLSFPMIDYPKPSDFSVLESDFGDCFHPESGELLLGDIVLCADRVLSQAEEYGHSVLREFSFLIAHSVLHLLGYDHISEEDASVMEVKQKTILSALGIER
ncbi:MAG: rRNA maturation RNase YbeY [bacterium]|nr:rRNA maturation RNase YbeY [bacterium]